MPFKPASFAMVKRTCQLLLMVFQRASSNQLRFSSCPKDEVATGRKSESIFFHCAVLRSAIDGRNCSIVSALLPKIFQPKRFCDEPSPVTGLVASTGTTTE